MTKTLIVGLGNPGQQYYNTPHNIGFTIVTAFALAEGAMPFHEERKFQAEIALHKQILFLKPLTFMNRSGESVKKAAEYYKIAPEQILVVHDEYAIPLGEVKISQGKGAANHNGVQSVIDALHTTTFPRFRIGIGKPSKLPLEAYVLSPIPEDDLPLLELAKTKTFSALRTAITSGVTDAMNHHNT